MLTQARLKELLSYDPEIGVFTWLAHQRRTDLIGQVAGFDVNGYVGICVDFRKYPAHRLAWLYMTGGWPKGEIDHRNRIRSDNRFDNLRDATHEENTYNQSIRSNNTSGVVGVCWDRANSKWRAHISPNGRMIDLGRFTALTDAVSARKAAERVHFGDYAPGA